MRVLFLCNRYIETMIGGVAEFIYQLPPALRSVGVESIIYSAAMEPTHTLSEPSILTNGFTAYSGPFARPSYWVRKKILSPVIELCKKERIDLIHAQGIYNSGFLAREIYRHTKIPYVVTSHGDILPVNSKRIRRKRAQVRCKKILRDAAGVTHLIPLMEDAAHQLFDTRHKSTLIGNGIHVKEWQPYLGTPEKNYFLGIGRLVPEKGFHILIDAYAKLVQSGVTTSLVIAGSGSEDHALQTQARELGLNVVTDQQHTNNLPAASVIFTGYVQGELKKQLIAESQFIVFPTQPTLWEEAFGIVQIEAMAAGKPLIASSTNATRYLQQFGLQTLLVNPSDSQDWAEKIAVLTRDATLRTTMGQMNIDSVHVFDWSIIAKQYKEAYRNASTKTL